MQKELVLLTVASFSQHSSIAHNVQFCIVIAMMTIMNDDCRWQCSVDALFR